MNIKCLLSTCCVLGRGNTKMSKARCSYPQRAPCTGEARKAREVSSPPFPSPFLFCLIMNLVFQYLCQNNFKKENGMTSDARHQRPVSGGKGWKTHEFKM